MQTYTILDSIPFLSKSFTFKIMFVSFIGIHVPLLGVIFLLLFLESQLFSEPLNLFLIVLGFTLLATAVTLFIIRNLLNPLKKVKDGFNQYIMQGNVPVMPQKYQDEVGQLMIDTQFTIVQIETLQKMKEEFISILSHDIRNAFNEIHTSAQLKDKGLKLEGIDLSENIRKIAKNQLQMLDETINVIKSRQHNYNKAIKSESIDSASIMEDVLTQFNSKLKKKAITVSTDLHKGEFKGPQMLIKNVLTNLLSNAIKFTGSGGKIAVGMRISRRNLIIEVKDTGIGFDQASVEKIFEFDSSVGREGTEKEVSHGIGMYLTQRLLGYQKGTIEAFSEGLGKGATFTATLPLKR